MWFTRAGCKKKGFCKWGLLEGATTNMETSDPPQLPLGILLLFVSRHTKVGRLHVAGAGSHVPGVDCFSAKQGDAARLGAVAIDDRSSSKLAT